MPFYNILNYFSKNIVQVLETYFRKETNLAQYVSMEEIRLRSAKSIVIKCTNTEIVLPYIVSSEDILETLQNICENSIYSYQNQICNGFITIRGRT